MLDRTLTPSAETRKLSKAVHFAKQVPVRARFSLGGDNPNAPDNARDNVRGLAVKFDFGNSASSDIVCRDYARAKHGGCPPNTPYSGHGARK